jgi:hypothetical protein
MLTPEERSLRARLAAHTLHAKRNPKETTAPARKAFATKFEREVDPDNQLDPVERLRRAEQARSAHYARMALSSAKARREKKEAAVRAAKARGHKPKGQQKPPEQAAEVEV